MYKCGENFPNNHFERWDRILFSRLADWTYVHGAVMRGLIWCKRGELRRQLVAQAMFRSCFSCVKLRTIHNSSRYTTTFAEPEMFPISLHNPRNIEFRSTACAAVNFYDSAAHTPVATQYRLVLPFHLENTFIPWNARFGLNLTQDTPSSILERTQFSTNFVPKCVVWRADVQQFSSADSFVKTIRFTADNVTCEVRIAVNCKRTHQIRCGEL